MSLGRRDNSLGLEGVDRDSLVSSVSLDSGSKIWLSRRGLEDGPTSSDIFARNLSHFHAPTRTRAPRKHRQTAKDGAEDRGRRATRRRGPRRVKIVRYAHLEKKRVGRRLNLLDPRRRLGAWPLTSPATATREGPTEKVV